MHTVFAIEPFYGGSHKSWLESLSKHSSFHFIKFTLEDRFWKWRMHGGAVTLAQKVNNSNLIPRFFLVSDMLDLCLFKSLLKPELQSIPFLLYFHENQLTYPTQEKGKNIDLHYGFINFTSALQADHVFFNSSFHKEIFLNELENFLERFPDYRLVEHLNSIKIKSRTLHLGLDFPLNLNKEKTNVKIPTFLWNHRWEFDKNPDLFFETLFKLKSIDFKFNLIVTGQKYTKTPQVFDHAKSVLKDEIIHFGQVDDKEHYWKLVQSSTHALITSQQDFFGISMIEACSQGVIPIIPNRLAFPEHFSEGVLKHIIYEHEQESNLHLFVKNCILGQPIHLAQSVKEDVYKYHWSNQIHIYDRIFNDIAFHINQLNI